MSQQLIVAGELLLMGFFLFIIFYIVIRLLSHRHEHSIPKRKKEDKKP